MPGRRRCHQRGSIECDEQLLTAGWNIPEPSSRPAAATTGPIRCACARRTRAICAMCLLPSRRRRRREACVSGPKRLLIELRCADDGGACTAQAAAQWSVAAPAASKAVTCWLTRADCAPEFAREVFGGAEVGVLARLVLIALARMWWKWWPVIRRPAAFLRGSAPGHRPTLRQQAWGERAAPVPVAARWCGHARRGDMLDVRPTRRWCKLRAPLRMTPCLMNC